jgi:cyclin-dependent kinase 2
MSKHNHYTIIKEIGSGAYGKIYEVKDKKGKTWALKQIKVNNEGIPCLLESTLMVSVNHPALNRAKEIFCDSSNLNIVQELAISDLSKHVKRTITPIDQLKRWFFKISSSLYALHKLGFVHGDIKGVNVLYFGGDDVRLGDFTLSVKLWSEDDMFCQHAGTYTHCSPELLLGKIWNRSFDIWALACLFYEIAFGKLMFNYQEKLDDHREMRIRYHNAIISWVGRDDYFSSDKYPMNFISPDRDSLLDTPEYAEFKDLISKMLKYEPSERIDIRHVLSHPFFRGQENVKFKIVDTPINILSSTKLERVSRTINRMMAPNKTSGINIADMNHINTLAMQIYIRAFGLVLIKSEMEEVVMAGSLWIAYKLVIGIPPAAIGTHLSNEKIKMIENSICNYLNYCFPINQDIIGFS